MNVIMYRFLVKIVTTCIRPTRLAWMSSEGSRYFFASFYVKGSLDVFLGAHPLKIFFVNSSSVRSIFWTSLSFITFFDAPKFKWLKHKCQISNVSTTDFRRSSGFALLVSSASDMCSVALLTSIVHKLWLDFQHRMTPSSLDISHILFCLKCTS